MIITTSKLRGLGGIAWPQAVITARNILKPLGALANSAVPIGPDSAPAYQVCQAIANMAHLGSPFGLPFKPFRTAWGAYKNSVCGRGGTAASIASALQVLVDAGSAIFVAAGATGSAVDAIRTIKNNIASLREEVQQVECPVCSGDAVYVPQLSRCVTRAEFTGAFKRALPGSMASGGGGEGAAKSSAGPWIAAGAVALLVGGGLYVVLH